MSEIEKMPDPVVDEKPAENEPTSANEVDKEPEEPESKVSKESGDKEETVLDVFKKYASSGPSWADLMVEEAIQHETAQQKLKMDQISEAIADFKEPFIIYVSNLSIDMTAEEVFYAFGGQEKVCDMFLYDGQTGEALVEFKNKNSLADALMLHEQIFRKKKLNVEYVDAYISQCYTIPQPSNAISKPSQPTQSTQDRGQANRMNNGAGRRGRNDRGPPSKGYDNRSNDNRQQPRQSNDVRMMSRTSNQSIPSLFNNNNSRNYPPMVEPRQADSRYSDRHYDPRHHNTRYPESRPSESKHYNQSERHSESKPTDSKVSKPSPFGNAKPVNTGDKLREFQEKIENEGKKPGVQKKQSVSSQHSQQLSEDQSVDEPKQPAPEPHKSSSEAVVEPEKKPHNITTVVSSKRRNLQHQRSDHSGSHARGGHKINVQQVQKFLGMSQKSLVDADKEERKKGGDGASEVGSTVSGNTNAERRYPKRRHERHEHRKDSSATTRITGGHRELQKDLSATTRITGGHRELQKQSSTETKSTPPPQLVVIPTVPENPPSEVSTPAADSTVSTPTTNEPALTEGNSEPTASAATKPKKSKSNKKKKSNAGIPNNTKFGTLEELRE